MAELKTKQTELSVDAYIDAIVDDTRRQDCRTLIKLMAKATNTKPKMWGSSIVGFGSYHYKYASGHEGDACLAGFASRKQDLTLYIMSGFERCESLMARIGKHKNWQIVPLCETSCGHRSEGLGGIGEALSPGSQAAPWLGGPSDAGPNHRGCTVTASDALPTQR